MRRQLSDTVSRLVEVVVEVSEKMVDWLANFSDYEVTTKLRESYELVKSASKIQTRCFYTTILQHRNLLIYNKDTTKLQKFYDNFTIVLQCFVNKVPVPKIK